MARVKATYELFVEYQKPFDWSYARAAIKNEKRPSRSIVLTPEDTLKYGGVCRDFARLLKWALQQVARSNSPSKDAEVFTPELQSGSGMDYGHMWVSVNLPVKDSNGQIKEFVRLDLDPTNYNVFLPIPSYGQNLSKDEMKQKFKACTKILTCLKNTKPESKKNPTQQKPATKIPSNNFAPIR